MTKMLYVTEETLDGDNGASINSKGTYKALSSFGQCDVISGSRFAIPEVLSSNFHSDYNFLWLRGLFSSFIIENLKKSFIIYDINGILHEEHKLKGGNYFECKIIYEFQKYCAKHANLVKVHTQSMKKYLQNCGIFNDFIQIPPIIDISQHPYVEKEFNFDKMIKVGYAGNSMEWQGMTTLLEAFKHLEKESNIMLNLIGPSKEDLFTNSRNIRVLDKCSHNIYISSILPSFDLFVIPRPSNVVTETTTPIKLIEAMASGVPVIASDVGGINEYVKHKKDAFLIEPDNPEVLANAILKLSENPNYAKRFSKNAREVSELTFDYIEISKRLRYALDDYL